MDQREHCPPTTRRAASLSSERSNDRWINFQKEEDLRILHKLQSGPGPRCESLRSNHSMGEPLRFTSNRLMEEPLKFRSDQSMGEPWNFRSDQSMGEPWNFRTEVDDANVSSGPHHRTHLDSLFKHLWEDLITFVQDKVKKFHRLLSTDYPECLEPVEDEEQRSSSEALLKIILNFLRRMDQKELAERLWSSKNTFMMVM
ncbi:unnamed protein product [Knipowitschia caucasica]